MRPSPHRIADLRFFFLEVSLAQTFAVATGSLESAQLIAVRVRLESGHAGWGEMAPFPAISGETRESTLAAARSVKPWLLGESVLEYRRLFAGMKERLPAAPAARCGLETALLDAFSRSLGIPLWAFLGGAGVASEHTTDVTIPVTDLEATTALAEAWYRRGFRRFKLKVGVDAELEVEKVLRVRSVAADSEFILDANGGFSLSEARQFLSALHRQDALPLLFEQPLAPADLEGAAALRSEFAVKVVADESARRPEDVLALWRGNAADVVNIKIMKSGLREAIQMALLAKGCGLALMIGGMLESRLAMGCSLSLVLGLGGFDFLDLDTPLLLRADPWRGGFGYRGSQLTVWHEPGLGLEPAADSDFLPCEDET